MPPATLYLSEHTALRVFLLFYSLVFPIWNLKLLVVFDYQFFPRVLTNETTTPPSNNPNVTPNDSSAGTLPTMP